MKKRSMFKFISMTVAVSLIFSSLTPPSALAQGLLNLPAPGTMIGLSQPTMPVMIKGLKVHPENPLLFDFILDTGKSGLKIDSPAFKDESEKLIKYFLASLTIKEDDLWVNLSPYEKDRMIPEELGKTELGRDMLAQDYVLKQLTASLIYPETELGAAFWDRVYAKAQEKFGTTDIPTDTFNKVWIEADKARVVEHNNAAYVVGARLKVLLEEDYIAQGKGHKVGVQNFEPLAPITAIIREIIIPEIEKEVNEGEHFAPLRQMYYAMILATWYKMSVKDALLNQVYSNKAKTAGVENDDPAVKEKIYDQYLAALKKGVFDYIKEDYEAATQQVVPRKYFSGGLGINVGNVIDVARMATREEKNAIENGDFAMVTANMDRADKKDAADPAVLAGRKSKIKNVPTESLKTAVDVARAALSAVEEQLNKALNPKLKKDSVAAIKSNLNPLKNNRIRVLFLLGESAPGYQSNLAGLTILKAKNVSYSIQYNGTVDDIIVFDDKGRRDDLKPLHKLTPSWGDFLDSSLSSEELVKLTVAVGGYSVKDANIIYETKDRAMLGSPWKDTSIFRDDFQSLKDALQKLVSTFKDSKNASIEIRFGKEILKAKGADVFSQASSDFWEKLDQRLSSQKKVVMVAYQSPVNMVFGSSEEDVLKKPLADAYSFEFYQEDQIAEALSADDDFQAAIELVYKHFFGRGKEKIYETARSFFQDYFSVRVMGEAFDVQTDPSFVLKFLADEWEINSKKDMTKLFEKIDQFFGFSDQAMTAGDSGGKDFNADKEIKFVQNEMEAVEAGKRLLKGSVLEPFVITLTFDNGGILNLKRMGGKTFCTFFVVDRRQAFMVTLVYDWVTLLKNKKYNQKVQTDEDIQRLFGAMSGKKGKWVDAAMLGKSKIDEKIEAGVNQLTTLEAVTWLRKLLEGESVDKIKVWISDQARKELHEAFGQNLSGIEAMIRESKIRKIWLPSTWSPEARKQYLILHVVNPKFDQLMDANVKKFIQFTEANQDLKMAIVLSQLLFISQYGERDERYSDIKATLSLAEKQQLLSQIQDLVKTQDMTHLILELDLFLSRVPHYQIRKKIDHLIVAELRKFIEFKKESKDFVALIMLGNLVFYDDYGPREVVASSEGKQLLSQIKDFFQIQNFDDLELAQSLTRGMNNNDELLISLSEEVTKIVMDKVIQFVSETKDWKALVTLSSLVEVKNRKKSREILDSKAGRNFQPLIIKLFRMEGIADPPSVIHDLLTRIRINQSRVDLIQEEVYQKRLFLWHERRKEIMGKVDEQLSGLKDSSNWKGYTQALVGAIQSGTLTKVEYLDYYLENSDLLKPPQGKNYQAVVEAAKAQGMRGIVLSERFALNKRVREKLVKMLKRKNKEKVMLAAGVLLSLNADNAPDLLDKDRKALHQQAKGRLKNLGEDYKKYSVPSSATGNLPQWFSDKSKGAVKTRSDLRAAVTRLTGDKKDEDIIFGIPNEWLFVAAMYLLLDAPGDPVGASDMTPEQIETALAPVFESGGGSLGGGGVTGDWRESGSYATESGHRDSSDSSGGHYETDHGSSDSGGGDYGGGDDAMMAEDTSPQPLDETKKQRILVVDDEEDIREIVAEILSNAGYDVDVAGDGVEALAKINDKRNQYHLVLSDYDMPTKKGLQLASDLKGINPDLPVILLSGTPDIEEAAKPYSNIKEVLKKPFGMALLKDRVERHALKVDEALLSKGGIDLNADKMNLDVDKSSTGVDIQFDPAMVAEFEAGDFTGVVPVILQIVPLASPLPLLGMEPAGKEEEVELSRS
ncbi:MAG: hypothetical protein A2Z81_01730 [Omnitrophica WOR_2 bacterium GWA2_45_18]|nr:MAG: hypothetical protein A2Z81_01730 [Omnitrophica WOR_2 bacterium GWA2_45_18]